MKTADKQLLLTEILLLIGAAVSSLMLASSLQLFTLYFFPYIIGALMAQKRPSGPRLVEAGRENTALLLRYSHHRDVRAGPGLA